MPDKWDQYAVQGGDKWDQYATTDSTPPAAPPKKANPITSRATRRNAQAQPGITPQMRAADPTNQKISTALQYAPAAAGALGTGIGMATAPLTTLGAVGGGYLGTKGGGAVGDETEKLTGIPGLGTAGRVIGGLGGGALGGAFSEPTAEFFANKVGLPDQLRSILGLKTTPMVNIGRGSPVSAKDIGSFMGQGYDQGAPDINMGEGQKLPADELGAFMNRGYKPTPEEQGASGRLPWQSGNVRLVLTPEEIADQQNQARLAGVVKEQLRPEAEVGGMYSAARGKVSKTPDYQGRIARRLYK